MSGVWVEFPEQWVAELGRAHARYRDALDEAVEGFTAEAKGEYAAACRDYAEVLASLSYQVATPEGLGFALRVRAVVDLEGEARRVEQWTHSKRDVGEQ